MTVHELQRRLNRFQLLSELADSVKETQNVIVDYNREQLLMGVDSGGNYLSPKYSEDPYFKSPESAKRYAEWKSRIEPKRDKPFDVPNLFITGRFHSGIDINVSKTEIDVFSHDANAGSIEAKFSTSIYGMNDETKREYIPKFLFPALKSRIEKQLGLKFS